MIRLALVLVAALAACEAAGDDRVAAARQDRPQARAPVAPVKPRAPRPGPEAANCPLTVRFGSYAMGIDRGALVAVEALLAGDPAVTGVDRHPWGREGEVTLCAHVGGDEAAERLARSIAVLLPADPRGPVRVATRAGFVFDAPTRR